MFSVKMNIIFAFLMNIFHAGCRLLYLYYPFCLLVFASTTSLLAEEILPNVRSEVIPSTAPATTDKPSPIPNDFTVLPTTPIEKNKSTISMERTLIILKPDCIGRNLVGNVITRFENAELSIVACKMTILSDVILREHYVHLAHLPFFSEIVEFMNSGPVILLVLEGPDAIARVREILGVTDSQAAAPGTIRKTWGTDKMRNIAHASDNLENAKKEIQRFFKPDEIFAR
jgi:nucleoside-diphosphate kinase